MDVWTCGLTDLQTHRLANSHTCGLTVLRTHGLISEMLEMGKNAFFFADMARVTLAMS